MYNLFSFIFRNRINNLEHYPSKLLIYKEIYFHLFSFIFCNRINNLEHHISKLLIYKAKRIVINCNNHDHTNQCKLLICIRKINSNRINNLEEISFRQFYYLDILSFFV
jgi:hypothetical protein